MKWLAFVLVAIPAIVVAQAIPNVVTHPWIERSCCITNSCCFEIDPEEVTQIGPGRYRIEASGQEIDARPSQDGKWYRCACDLIEGVWTVHPQAHTRCLYVFNGV